MTLIESLIAKYPMAGATFLKWLQANETIRPIAIYLKQPVEELPEELAYGVIMRFLDDHGIMIGIYVDKNGKKKLSMNTRHYKGAYRKRWTATVVSGAVTVMRQATTRGFHELEKRIGDTLPPIPKNERNEVLIGIDVDQVIAMAKEKQLEHARLVFHDR